MTANKFEIRAEVRHDVGKGASRRLRREGKIPAILYGAGQDPVGLSIAHDPIMHSLEDEGFYSHILDVNVDGKNVRAVLKALQRHPYKPVILHLDLQRVSEDEKLRMTVPLHFDGEDVAPGIKQGGGIFTHHITEVEVACLPRDLPQFLTVDVSGMNVNETRHLSDIRIPAGVELIDLPHDATAEQDQPVVSIHLPRAALESEEEETPEEGAAPEGEGG